MQDLDHEKFGIISNTILEVVNEDAKTKKGYSASTFQRCFAIKTGINGLLDVARASYSDIVAKVHGKQNSNFPIITVIHSGFPEFFPTEIYSPSKTDTIIQ